MLIVICGQCVIGSEFFVFVCEITNVCLTFFIRSWRRYLFMRQSEWPRHLVFRPIQTQWCFLCLFVKVIFFSCWETFYFISVWMGTAFSIDHTHISGEFGSPVGCFMVRLWWGIYFTLPLQKTGSFFAKNSEVLSILDNSVCFKNI